MQRPRSHTRRGPDSRRPSVVERSTSERLVAIGVLVAIAAGGFLHLAGASRAGDVVWAVGIMVTLVPLTWSVLKSLLRRDVGVDAIALVAMVGALALGEYLAGSSSPSCLLAAMRSRRPPERGHAAS